MAESDSDRVKRVAGGVRKKLMGMALKPKDMGGADKADLEFAQGKRTVDEPGAEASGRLGLDELQGRDGVAADKDPEPDIKLQSMSIQPISKSKHFRSIVDAYKKSK